MDFKAHSNPNHPGILQQISRSFSAPVSEKQHSRVACGTELEGFGSTGVVGSPGKWHEAELRVLLGFWEEGGINTSSGEHRKLGKWWKSQTQANT